MEPEREPDRVTAAGREVASQADALGALRGAWPGFVAECRRVLASELHYQARCSGWCHMPL